MKYLAILDFGHTSFMDHIKKAQAYKEEIKKNPDKYPSVPFGMHFMYKGPKGFSVWEGDEAQVARKVAFMLPEVQYTLVPIVAGSEFVKTYMEVKRARKTSPRSHLHPFSLNHSDAVQKFYSSEG